MVKPADGDGWLCLGRWILVKGGAAEEDATKEGTGRPAPTRERAISLHRTGRRRRPTLKVGQVRTGSWARGLPG
jgi:hypothetical protein